MFGLIRRWRRACSCGALALLAAGCSDGSWDFLLPRDPPPPEAPPERAAEIHPALADTIGTRTLLSGVQPMALRGYGVVIGLGSDGGRDCPTAVREYLIDFFQREYAPDGSGGIRPRIAPARLLDSPDTSVVQVTAVVPAGAPRGTRLDVHVEAIDTETRSLAGGLLLPCELKIFETEATGRGILAGRTLARAQGMVFTNPFRTERGSAREPDARRGLVLGGAVTLEERTARLLLSDPSYALARQIENRINERFGHSPAAAEALSMGYVQLTTPRAFADRPERFLELVGHLNLESSPLYVERRLAELSTQLRDSPERLHNIALVWEGIGSASLPAIQPLYSDPDPALRFFAARAGVRLGDPTAVPVLAAIAADPDEPRRLPAVRELGESGLTQAALRLVPLLSDSDAEVRIAAYTGLLRFRHPAIASRSYASPLETTQVNLTLDVVDCGGPALIYVRRTREPRIAVFGKEIAARIPMFYAHPREWVTLNALQGADLITMYSRTRRNGLLSDSLFVSPRVVELIHRMASLPIKDERGQFQGLGLHYALIVEVLEALCADGTIPATLRVETASLIDVLGLPEQPQRPEADAPPPPQLPAESEPASEPPPAQPEDGR